MLPYQPLRVRRNFYVQRPRLLSIWIVARFFRFLMPPQSGPFDAALAMRMISNSVTLASDHSQSEHSFFSASVSSEFEQEFSLGATVGDMPDLPRDKVPFRACHDSPWISAFLILKIELLQQNKAYFNELIITLQDVILAWPHNKPLLFATYWAISGLGEPASRWAGQSRYKHPAHGNTESMLKESTRWERRFSFS